MGLEVFSNPYIYIIATCCAAVAFAGRREFGLYSLLILILVLVSGLRDGVGMDFRMYLGMFTSSDYSPLRGLDPLYRFLSLGVNLVDLDFQVVVMISALITNLLIGWEVWVLSKNKLATFSIYVLFPIFYLSSLNLIRQYMAIAITGLCFTPYFLGNKWRTVFVILVASMFHWTAIVVVVVFLVRFTRTFVSSVLFLAAMGPGILIAGKIKYLSERMVENSSDNVMLPVYIVMFIFCILFLWRYNRDDRFYKALLFVCVVALAATVASALGKIPDAIGLRVANYALIPVLVVIDRLISRIVDFVSANGVGDFIIGRNLISVVLFVIPLSVLFYRASYLKGYFYNVYPYAANFNFLGRW